MIGVQVTYRNNFKGVLDRITQSSNAAVDQTSQLIVDLAKEKVRVLSGDTQRSIHIENVSSGIFGYARQVVATTPQALFLELGTIHQPPYPFMGPAAEEALTYIDRIIDVAFSW